MGVFCRAKQPAMNTLRKELDRHRSHVFCAFPEDARWNAERQAVEFGVEIGEYRAVVRVPRRAVQRLPPERCVEAYHLQRTPFVRAGRASYRQHWFSDRTGKSGRQCDRSLFTEHLSLK
jgi:hypothetical protein